MELNSIATGLVLIGTSIKNTTIENDIVDLKDEAKRSFGISIYEPSLEKREAELYSEIRIDFQIEIDQQEGKFRLVMALEGAFCSSGDIGEEDFMQMVCVNGAAALIGIARGKIEAITANVFHNGKIVIPFVNVIDYYKSLEKIEKE